MIKEIELHFNELTKSMQNLKNAVNEIIKQENEMIKEIKVGDYIEKSELDTEQKYNDVVEVFEQWGFTFHQVSNDRYSNFDGDCLLYVNNGWLLMDYQFSDNRWRKRKLTYDDIMSLKKVDVDNCNVDKLVSGGKVDVSSGPFKSADTTEKIIFDDHFKPKSNRVSTVNRDLEGQMASKKQSISVQYLNRCIDVQAERGEQYDSKGTGERSFAAAAAMFNAATGKDLKGSDICLIQDCLKVVRQYSDPSRIHDDSLLDKVSYSALWAEELNKELGELNGEVK